ncbi:quasimodo 3 [Cinnamomum micranthum f. kanehirae]|uniref:Methyltransferase n=1 Tax=Cinnamomum micranthum f. kanehirae TaxID=337451 RepID=A0A443PF23_9MAGN|nr:quasimodo 3 [Cinnamomum micranthum f. kanehirae]
MSKRNARHWSLLDLVSATFFGFVFVFFVLVFTPFGDSLAASGRQALARSTSADPRQRERLLALTDAGNEPPIDACPAEAVDHMPCEDPRRNSQLSREMNFYRERHCPSLEESMVCLIPPPVGYQIPVPWPESLHKIWHSNMPHNKIAERKGHQGWMKKEGPYFIFPGGGTMFPDGAVQYIEKLGLYIPISGGVLRTALDMGCGVGALSSGTCSSYWRFGIADGTYFIEVDRLLRPGGYLVISGPPVQWPKQDKEWADLQALARALCYELIVVDGNTVIWKKPSGDSCPSNQNEFGLELCNEYDNPSDGWYFTLKKCISKLPSLYGEIAVGFIPNWPDRLKNPPARVTLMKNGIDLFEADTRRWARRVAFYKKFLKIKLGTSAIRNVMDMNAFFGGFAASLLSDPVWVMNVVPTHKPSTLDVIYDRGLIGVYHDWCEAFSTYPRTYDLIHVTSIESLLRDSSSGASRCHLLDLMIEMDRILRPDGTVLVRDSSEVIDKVAGIARAIKWKVTLHDPEPQSTGREKILVASKQFWKLLPASH